MSPSATQHSHREESPGVHVRAQAARTDDTLVAELGQVGGSRYFVGLAVPSIDDARSTYSTIKSGETYFILDDGEVDLVIPGSLGFTPAKGDNIYIDPSDQSLHNATGTGFQKVGRVRYLGPERGLASNMWTISFKARKDF
jgi:hypothetical protein